MKYYVTPVCYGVGRETHFIYYEGVLKKTHLIYYDRTYLYESFNTYHNLLGGTSGSTFTCKNGL